MSGCGCLSVAASVIMAGCLRSGYFKPRAELLSSSHGCSGLWECGVAVPVRITRGQPVSDLSCCSLWQEQEPAECGLSGNNPSGLEHRDTMREKTAALAFFLRVLSVMEYPCAGLNLATGSCSWQLRFLLNHKGFL